ncbi:MFS transporter [Paraburkholderia guartelaensis]|uniref:MFS transporter n=1 Tax=Paraburkholderia guartelaensis TaxID=2546446 RepID=A0A4R5L505_9BURK|nr:MFS transporter [Paraburkholderia guartelaensis]TDG03334.1 MFS transporter [Paraburkholderia guartelaensis]
MNSLPQGTNTSAARRRHAVVSATIGNALEWFDIIVFGFLAITISKLFFPAKDELTSLLMTVATFGVSFFVRPIGAIVLGIYADRAGRKAALSLSMLLMTVGTLAIAFAPTYASIGPWATLVIVVSRVIQGFSAGGEFGSSTTFLLEHTPERQRGFYASWQVASQGLTALLAALFGMLVTLLPLDAQLSWGWRVPFLFGALIGPVGFYIRRKVEETPEFVAEAQKVAGGAAPRFASGLGGLVPATGLIVLSTIGSYVLLLYMPTYAIRQLHLTPSLAYYSVMAAGLVQLVLSPCFGALADRVGAARVMAPGGLLVGFGIYPALVFIDAAPSVTRLVAMQLVLGIGLAAYFAPVPALMGRLFPTASRTTGLSISYSFAVTIFGGFAPFIITWLIGKTGDNLSPAYYVAFGALVSLIALWYCRAHSGRDPSGAMAPSTSPLVAPKTCGDAAHVNDCIR